MRHLFTAALLFILTTQPLQAQQSDSWSLQRAVQYALAHNISIQQNVLNERLARYTLLQSRLSQLPNVNANGGYGRSYGRSVDPTTNQFVSGTSSYDFMNVNGSADVLLFGWFQKRNTIAANKFSLKAAAADLEQLQDDISLNVATGYLRALLAQEQIRVSEKQVELSKAQLNQTRKFAEAGRLPELSVAQLEAQLAGDSATLIQAMADYTASIIDMKALLNLDFNTPFDIVVPDVKLEDQVAVNTLSPEEIYAEARKQLGTIRSSEFKLAAAAKRLDAAKGNLWPQLGLSAQAGTNWASTFKNIVGFNQTGEAPNGTYIPIRFAPFVDTLIPIYQPTGTVITEDVSIFDQFDNNFRQIISVNLSIPLFNGWQSQYNIRQARINMLTQELNKSQAELNLKQDVYKAYNDARNSIQKYYAAERSANAARRALEFAQKRYDLGLINTVEYLTTQNTMFSAASRLASSKYDLIFKLKVIDYYLGKELKL